MSEKYLKVSTATTISASSSSYFCFYLGVIIFQAGLGWMEKKQPFLLVLKNDTVSRS